MKGKITRHLFLIFCFSISSGISQIIASSHIGSGKKVPKIGYQINKGIEQDSSGIGDEPDTLEIYIGKDDSLQLPLDKSSFKNDLLDLLRGTIFRDTAGKIIDDETDLTESEEKYLPYEGRIIENIYLSKVPVFGESEYDTLKLLITPTEQFGNSLHINTKDWVIFNNLLFKEGDEVHPFQLADNERILRRLSFIRDARILVISREEDDNVDILVVTRDVFSLGLSINARAVNDITLGVFDKNLFGIGWEFRNIFRHRSQLENKIDYEGVLDISNIQGSFIGLTLQYLSALDTDQQLLRFYKYYLTPETQYAGGIDYIRTTLKDELQNYQAVTSIQNTYDFWLGHSFLIGGSESRKSVKLGIRYFKKTYDKRPLVLADSNYTYHTQKLYLANLILDKREFLTSSMIFGFGITEDIPIGYVYEFTGGFSKDEFKDRPYIGFDFRFASWYDEIGYMALTARAATFMYQHKTEDGMIGLSYLYFSPLTDIGNYELRNFFSINYITGINRVNDKFISIRDKNGIRGLSNDQMDGIERLVLNLETIAFTPWNFAGFQFALFTFADLGWISPEKGLWRERNFSSAFGFGCRIRNEGLVFQTLTLRLAYFPNVPDNGNHFGYDIETSDPILFRQFSRGKPAILPFE